MEVECVGMGTCRPRPGGLERRPCALAGRSPELVSSALRDWRCAAAFAATPRWADALEARAGFARPQAARPRISGARTHTFRHAQRKEGATPSQRNATKLPLKAPGRKALSGAQMNVVNPDLGVSAPRWLPGGSGPRPSTCLRRAGSSRGLSKAKSSRGIRLVIVRLTTPSRC